MNPPEARTLHHQSSLVFDELTADTASTRATVIVMVQLPDQPAPQVLTHGHYHDRWRKTPEGWRVEHRRFIPLGFLPKDDPTEGWRS